MAEPLTCPWCRQIPVFYKEPNLKPWSNHPWILWCPKGDPDLRVLGCLSIYADTKEEAVEKWNSVTAHNQKAKDAGHLPNPGWS